jgi:6-phospho-beta-glucosidase
MARVAVLGGSSASAPQLAAALADWAATAGERMELVLVGRSASKLDAVASACRAVIAQPGVVTVDVATQVRAGLADADIVINQVRVGGLDGRGFDERFPWELGLPGEETAGPGGFSLACRTIPVVRDLFSECASVAPDALIINLTNPAGIVHQVAARTTSLRVLTLCDAPAALIKKAAGLVGVDPASVRPGYIGTNHAGWLTGLWRDGENLLPAALDRADEISPGIDPRLFAWLGAVPNPYLRFFYHPDQQLAAQQAKGVTRAEELRSWEAGALSAYASGGDPRPEATGRKAVWYELCVVPVIAAFLTRSELTMVVNVTNGSLIPSLPAFASVELTATIGSDGTVTPLPVDPLAPDAAALLAANAAYECLTVDAMLGGDRDARVRALAANPLVPSIGVAGKGVDLIEARWAAS